MTNHSPSGGSLTARTLVTRHFLVFLVFMLSGAAGLIYEIVWSRQLVLVFGNTTQAVSAILTGFFGGMAIGAVIGGRIADRVRSPLRLYAYLEIALVAVVLVTPVTFGFINAVYRGIYPSLEGTALLTLARLALAVAALSPATIMMGATFPALVRHLARSAELGQSFGRLYSVNTIGAVIGTLIAGMALIEVLGLTGALRVGAACSAIAGVVAFWLARGESTPAPGSVLRDRGTEPFRDTIRWLPLIVVFVSGLTSLGYQVTWMRLLSSGTGGFTYVFTIILALFLTGIALGAATFNATRPRIKDPVRLLALSQIALAALSVAGLILIISRPAELDPERPLLAISALLAAAMLTVLPTTFCMGFAFPAASMLLRGDRDRAGAESGTLIAVNTGGAILASLAIPFVLMPLVGSPSIIILLALTNATLGVGLSLWAAPRRPVLGGTGILAGIVIIVVAATPGLVVQPNEARIKAAGWTLLESHEDEIASVQAGDGRDTRELWVGGTSMTLLTVDAKLMPIIPLMARPESDRALIVAFGMGTSFRSALIAGLRTDAVELVPSVPKMFGHYYDDAVQVLANPAGRVIIADGRNHLDLVDERFDIIVTDPPPPMESAGVSVISSLEYYIAGREHLTEAGVMMQWTPFGAVESELKEHMRTFALVFPNVTVVRGPGGFGFYMLGSLEPLSLDDATVRDVLGRPGVLADISSAYDAPASTVEGWVQVIAGHAWFDDAALRAYVGDGPLITDDHPRPEYFMLRRLFGEPT